MLFRSAAGHGLHAVGAQQPQTDQLVAHTEITLPVAACQAAGHQAADAPQTRGWGWGGTRKHRGHHLKGWIHRQPLAVGSEGLLQLLQRGARPHRDREVTGAVLADPPQGGAAHHAAGPQRSSPVETARQPGG